MRVRYDRRLSPGTAAVLGVRPVSGANEIPIDVSVDPLLPGIVIRPLAALEPDVGYDLGIGSVRDLDGAPVTSVFVHFQTGFVASDERPPPANWLAVLALFRARCASCHGGSAPLQGLDLSSSAGVGVTARNVASRQQGPAPLSDLGATRSGLVGMPRIFVDGSRGEPERSYLLYKLLGDSHVLGDRMPPFRDGGSVALGPDEIRIIAEWIEAGAPVE